MRPELLAMLRNRKVGIAEGVKAAAKVVKQRLNALELFRPTEYQEPVVLSPATEMLVRGGTRSGKSTIVAAMIAAYLLDLPITFADGRKVFVREPAWSGRDAVVWMVGLQLNHVGQTLYRLLCRPGAFQIVRDPKTGMWRAWQPGRIPGDELIPEKDQKPAPPFIPPSAVLKEVWDNKAKFEFSALHMQNGSVAYAYASTAAVKRGDPVNRIWIDEEIADSNHYPEWQSRLSDRKGRIWWSTWPEMKVPALLTVYRRSEDQAEEVRHGVRAYADVVNFQFRGSDSPFIDADEKRKRSEGWTPEQQRARDFGEFVTDTIIAYPEFSRNLHVVDYGDGNPLNDRIREVMRSLNYTVPSTWSVDLILDPGTANPALLWGAIPTPEFWDEGEPYYIVYRELAVPRIDAYEIAKRARYAEPGRAYSRFIIDKKAGDQTPVGFSWDVQAQYSQAFRREGLRCKLTGDMFLPSLPVWVLRSMKLRRWMRGRECGRPQLRVVAHQCPVLMRQLEQVTREVTKDEVKDKLASGQKHDVLDTLEYWAGSDPVYLVPDMSPALDSPGMRIFQAEQKYWADRATHRNNEKRGPVILGLQ